MGKDRETTFRCSVSDNPIEPLLDEAEMHFLLRKGPNSSALVTNGYLKESQDFGIKLIESFIQNYPEVELDTKEIYFRVKSRHSIVSKIKNLSIERITKLAMVDALAPDFLDSNINMIKNDSDKPDPVLPDYGLLGWLLSERIDEKTKQINSIDEDIRKGILSPDTKNPSPSEYREQLQILLDINTPLSLDQAEQIKNVFLIDGAKIHSNSTKRAIARMLYARVVKSPLISDFDKIVPPIISKEEQNSMQDTKPADGTQGFLHKLDELYGTRSADDLISIASINKIINNKKHMDDPAMDNHYESKIDRLLDQQEFLRVKDLMAMQVIIKSIPKGFRIPGNDEFNTCMIARDNLTEPDDPAYDTYNQKCISLLNQDFKDKVHYGIIPLLKDTNAKIIKDSLKSKEKTNGYIAEHAKFELCGNPDYSIEVQFKSSDVLEKSRGNGSASHSKRAGKTRFIPDCFTYESLTDPNKKPSPNEIISSGLKVLKSTPIYYKLVNKDGKLQFSSLFLFNSFFKYHELGDDPRFQESKKPRRRKKKSKDDKGSRSDKLVDGTATYNDYNRHNAKRNMRKILSAEPGSQRIYRNLFNKLYFDFLNLVDNKEFRDTIRNERKQIEEDMIFDQSRYESYCKTITVPQKRNSSHDNQDFTD